MTQSHSSGNLIDVLTTWPAGTRKAFFQIGLANAKTPHSLLQLIHLLNNMAAGLATKAATLTLAGRGGQRSWSRRAPAPYGLWAGRLQIRPLQCSRARRVKHAPSRSIHLEICPLARRSF